MDTFTSKWNKRLSSGQKGEKRGGETKGSEEKLSFKGKKAKDEVGKPKALKKRLLLESLGKEKPKALVRDGFRFGCKV